jgi:6-phosphogluconate dehydrogenase
MRNFMKKEKYEMGMVGLGVMGRNLLLNMADNGYSVAGYDKDRGKVDALRGEAERRDIRGAEELKEFIGLLKKPRAIMLLVPAGEIVDSVVEELVPGLDEGDLIIDAGNSYYRDTDRRTRGLLKRNIKFMGVGVSGGEYGARHGPSIMPGGESDAWDRVRVILEAVSAKVDGEPCVARLGPGSAGHYVKMVHNGIEYALLELIAEAYDIMKRGLALGNEQMSEEFSGWNEGELEGYLVEIASRVLLRKDNDSGGSLVDVILDEAGQKGTGKWASQDAMDLGVAVPTIDIAVAMRNLSGQKGLREEASRALGRSKPAFGGDRKGFTSRLGSALYAAFIISYAQGMALLGEASAAYKYGLDPEAVARIWRGGCIIRAALLEDIRSAFRIRSGLPNLLLDPRLGRAVADRQDYLRGVIREAVDLGIPVPALSASLGYFDAVLSERLPANLIQALRDYFGSHTYKRIDRGGSFHTEWNR